MSAADGPFREGDQCASDGLEPIARAESCQVLNPHRCASRWAKSSSHHCKVPSTETSVRAIGREPIATLHRAIVPLHRPPSYTTSERRIEQARRCTGPVCRIQQLAGPRSGNSDLDNDCLGWSCGRTYSKASSHRKRPFWRSSLVF